MTPPTPSRPVRITNYNRADIVFPCWLNLRATGWCHFQGSTWATMAIEDATHFAPDSPECPTCVPDDLALEDEPPVDTTQRLTCRCGDPSQPGVVHCKILPCYLAEPTPTAPDLPADEAALLEVIRRHYPEELPAPIPVTAPLPASEGTPLVLGHPATAEWCRAVDEHHAATEGLLAEAKSSVRWALAERDRAEREKDASYEHFKAVDDERKQGQEKAFAELQRALNETASLRTLLATAEKERDEARFQAGINEQHLKREEERARESHLFFIAVLDALNIESIGSVATLRKQVLARLTPSASQSAEAGQDKRAEACAMEIQAAWDEYYELSGYKKAPAVPDYTAIIAKHFTTPTQ
jgi:hypothetical protein